MNRLREMTWEITGSICAIDKAYDRLSKRLGVTGNLLWLLYILDDGRTHTQKQICQEWLFPKTTINTLIKECREAGYVTLEAIPGQRRERVIRLTPAGRAYAREVLTPVYAAEERALAETIAACSPAFIEHFRRYTHHLQEALALCGKEERS